MLIFLFGEDTYRSKKKLIAIKKKFLGGASSGNLFCFEAEEITNESLKKMLGSQQLFSSKKLIIIENVFSLNKNLIKEFSKFIQDIEKDKNYTLVLRDKKIEEKKLFQTAKTLFNKLKKIKYAQEFALLKPWQIKTFIKKNFLLNASIEEKALNLLIDFLGNNLWAVENEINKLIYLKENNLIKQADVEKLILKTNQKIFDLIDAVGSKRKKDALRLLNEQLESGESIEKIIYFLIRQYRIILEIKGWKKSGEAQNINGLARKLRVPPFACQKVLLQEIKYSLEDLKKIYKKFLELDFLRKTKPVYPKMILDLLILKA